ncbi:MAG: hypothetical protein A2W93_09635 [Bacteroidetes bacterium GWF2_43_63]|nr:MAG: hypothetical protein A2W94_07120 [Bacteroidetes bacterium GWE2_42_42]OFY54568.1 MAG: hypothetical protein A2W93_09635 [Bacteroidetes bacterium GWF2_43_63]HBG70622.1 hypothetical protein [Bacteroidales bacterium]HCB60919.1 hypothetical protein [Bacteroidales bacterium]
MVKLIFNYEFEDEKYFIMKEYSPKRRFNLPLWIRVIIQAALFASFIVFLHLLKVDELMGRGVSFKSNWLLWILAILGYYIYKIQVNSTPVSYLKFDYEHKELLITFRFLYLIKKRIIFKFGSFTYRVRKDGLFFGASESIRLYQNNRLKVKLNPKNGWTKGQIEEIIAEVKQIGNIDNRKIWI